MKKLGSYGVAVACLSLFFDGQILLEPLRAHLLFSWGPCFLREGVEGAVMQVGKKKRVVKYAPVRMPQRPSSNATFRIAPAETKLLVSKCASMNATKTKRRCHI